MDSVLTSDIFFFVTTIVVCIIGLLVACVLVYLLRILMDVKKLSEKVKKEGEAIVKDIEGLHDSIKKNTIKLSDILSFGFLRKKVIRRKIKKDN